MKTSNKLFSGFSGVLVLLMLLSAIILKANYNKGITNTISHQPKQDPDYAKVTIPAFKALVLKSTVAKTDDREATVYIRESPEYQLEFYKNATYNLLGDTLYIEISKPRDVVLFSPAIRYIDNRTGYAITVSEVNSPSLRINAGGQIRVYMHNSKINSFSFTGKENNTLEVTEDNVLDSVKVTMGKRGSLYFYAPYQAGDFSVDSLDNLNITGKSLKSLKRFN
ncbi:hypothetical protein [Chitinophaga sp. OAE865]|uniref:hypothetical protein n=1 Tax=Chitinophaga sp. OAE865 TaxID=2817898 RepID=UPI001AE5723C